MALKISLDEIKQRLYNTFKYKYEYDFTNFKNTHSKIGVKCPTHGWSDQILKNLFKGHGCNKCGEEKSSDKQRKPFDEVLKKFKDIHGDKYNYSKFNYIKNRVISVIICPIHGEFNQSAWTHSKGHGCPSCSKNKRFSKEDFVRASLSKHTKRYIYDYVDYENMHKKVKIICPIHGEFQQLAISHINGSGCAKCNQSKGEKMVEQYLIKNDIKFISQKKFDDCRYINYLIFDFYLTDYNTCIEFNGIQHYFPIDVFGGKNALEINIKRDKIKEDYCKDKDMKLIIIKQDRKHINIDDVSMQINNIKSKL